jgi:hypothetical protein
VRNDLARFYTLIEIMDEQVGDLIKMLKDDGLYDNTIIFFFSDNGGSLPWMKREILERGTHVPLIVRLAEGARAGETSDELVSGVDLAPTVLSLAGVPIPKHMQGQAFLGEQKSATPRRYVFAGRDRIDTEYDRVRAVRDARFRYLLNHLPQKPYYQNIHVRLQLPMMLDILRLRTEGKLDAHQAAWFDTKPVEELYDVDEDPWELKNLADAPQHGEKLAELRQALEEWTAQVGDLGAVAEKDMIKQMWNGGSAPPATAVPEVVRDGESVRITCATPGASVGYWIQRPGQPPPELHVVQSWDYAMAMPQFAGVTMRNGDKIRAPRSWQIYDQPVTVKMGQTLHLSAQRIGFTPAVVSYRLTPEGFSKVVAPVAPGRP